MQLDWGIKNPI